MKPPFSPAAEKKFLQIACVFACAVPLSAGISGMLGGPAFLNGISDGSDMDNHFRYLSGLLLGIGIGFLSLIRNIEQNAKPIRLLTSIVIIGGVGRLAGILLEGLPSVIMLAALVMELVVTPLLCAWQHRLAKRYRMS